MADNSPSTPVVNPPHLKGDMQDPSPLTTQMVQREIAQLHEVVTAELDGLRREIFAILDGTAKALRKVENYPTDMDVALSRLRELFEEKFNAINVVLCEREKRANQRDESNHELLSEQRSSSETAIGKSEASLRQQLDAQTVMIRDMKERLDRSEGKTEGAVWLWGAILGAIMVVSGVVGTVMVIMTR